MKNTLIIINVILLMVIAVLGNRYKHIDTAYKQLIERLAVMSVEMDALEKTQIQLSSITFDYLLNNIKLKKYLPNSLGNTFVNATNSLIDSNKDVVNLIKETRSRKSDNKNNTRCTN